MITLFYGSDQVAIGGEVARLHQEFANTQPDGMVYRFSDEDFDQERFEELSSGGQLFANAVMVVARNLWVDQDRAAWLKSQLAALTTSSTRFVFWEEELEKSVAATLNKSGGVVSEFALRSEGFGKQADFNVFSLTDALLKRNRRELWLRFTEASYRGVPAEEMFWKLVWQVKILLWVKQTTGEIKDLKPFVVSKARQASGKFSTPELQSLSSELVQLWHGAVGGEVDLALGLEQFILRL